MKLVGSMQLGPDSVPVCACNCIEIGAATVYGVARDTGYCGCSCSCGGSGFEASYNTNTLSMHVTMYP